MIDKPTTALAEGTAFLAVTGVLHYVQPILAVLVALFGLIWYGVCIWESRTMVGIRRRFSKHSEVPEAVEIVASPLLNAVVEATPKETP